MSNPKKQAQKFLGNKVRAIAERKADQATQEKEKSLFSLENLALTTPVREGMDPRDMEPTELTPEQEAEVAANAPDELTLEQAAECAAHDEEVASVITMIKETNPHADHEEVAALVLSAMAPAMSPEDKVAESKPVYLSRGFAPEVIDAQAEAEAENAAAQEPFYEGKAAFFKPYMPIVGSGDVDVDPGTVFEPGMDGIDEGQRPYVPYVSKAVEPIIEPSEPAKEAAPEFGPVILGLAGNMTTLEAQVDKFLLLAAQGKSDEAQALIPQMRKTAAQLGGDLGATNPATETTPKANATQSALKEAEKALKAAEREAAREAKKAAENAEKEARLQAEIEARHAHYRACAEVQQARDIKLAEVRQAKAQEKLAKAQARADKTLAKAKQELENARLKAEEVAARQSFLNEQSEEE